jgi:hypothetical protein
MKRIDPHPCQTHRARGALPRRIQAELLQERGHLEVDTAPLDLIVLQVIHHAQRHANVLAGGGNSGKLADVLADEVAFGHGIAVAKERRARRRRGIEGDMIEIVQHTHYPFGSVMFLPCRHDGEDDVARHHADITVLRVEIAQHRFAGAFDRYDKPPVAEDGGSVTNEALQKRFMPDFTRLAYLFEYASVGPIAGSSASASVAIWSIVISFVMFLRLQRVINRLWHGHCPSLGPGGVERRFF